MIYSEKQSYEMLHKIHLQNSRTYFDMYRMAKTQKEKEKAICFMQNQANLLKITANNLANIVFEEDKEDEIV